MSKAHHGNQFRLKHGGEGAVKAIQENRPFRGPALEMQKRVEVLGMWGALLLGVLFALSFCPVSAALFFGSLIPLALRCESGVILPSAYGIATGLPVLTFAVLIAMGAKCVGQAYDKLVPVEKWARRITGAIFILVGIYYCLVHVFGLFS